MPAAEAPGARSRLSARGRVVEASALVGRRNGQNPKAPGQGLPGQGQPLLIEEVQVQAAEAEPPAGQGPLNQGVEPWLLNPS